MERFIQQIDRAVQSVWLDAPLSFSWCGRRSDRLRRDLRGVVSPEAERAYLLRNLQAALYTNWYCVGGAPIQAGGPQHNAFIPSTGLVQAFSEANKGHGSWQTGWELQRDPVGNVVSVRKSGLELAVNAVASAGSMRVAPGGAPVEVLFQKENLALLPGYYLALGDAPLDEASSGAGIPSRTLLRFYWNLTPEGAVILVEQVTRALNSKGIPFRLKVADHMVAFNRCDSGVLYVNASQYKLVVDVVKNIHKVLQRMSGLKELVPALTLPLAPGLGLAEDPGSGASFGEYVSRLLANGLLRAYDQGAHANSERLTAVLDCFKAAGVDLDAPYLTPSRGDDNSATAHPNLLTYRSFSQATVEGRNTDRRNKSKRTHHQGGLNYLDVAHSIGATLIGRAAWWQGRCTWIGQNELSRDTESWKSRRQLIEADQLGGNSYSVVGADLYSGTAGIALFLAGLYKATGQADAKLAAIGAVLQSLDRAEEIPPDGRLGLYTGWIGIALSAIEVAGLTGQDALAASGLELARRCANSTSVSSAPDFLSGAAGAAVGCLRLSKLTGELRLYEYALLLGESLCDSAARLRHRRHALTGLAHGAAGIGQALLELWHETGNQDYYAAAARAFDYERRSFDPVVENWPDFRQPCTPDGRGGCRFVYSASWCHGAPGIALSRLRSWELTRDPLFKTEAEIALSTTMRWLDEEVDSGGGNYSLCHGLSGNTEVLVEGSRLLDWRVERVQELKRKVADRGIESYASGGRAWPCGASTGFGPHNKHLEPPGLMLGLAGIGLFYLRMHGAAPGVLQP